VQDQLDLTKGEFGKRPKMGPIGIQDHGFAVMVRNVRVKEFTK
jgi:hypothetical protein